VLLTFVADPRLVLAVQLLDGVTSACAMVLTIVIITDLTKGTGRFNLAQGVLGMLTGLAAVVSTASTGFIGRSRPSPSATETQSCCRHSSP
jgi:hypothetical protein